jgi:DNA-binding MarR family transcriptional regulator
MGSCGVTLRPAILPVFPAFCILDIRMPRLSASRTISSEQDAALRFLELLETLGRHNGLRDPIANMVETMGFTPPQLHAVLWIGRDRALTMGELAGRLGVTEKTITGIVDRLERRQFVKRLRHPTDRRVVKVELTRKGQTAYKSLHAEIVDKTAQFLGLLDSQDRSALFRILERLIERRESES